jgi:hypothetical protein
MHKIKISITRETKRYLQSSDCQAASFGNCLPTFRDNVSVPYSRVKSLRRKESPLPYPSSTQLAVIALAGYHPERTSPEATFCCGPAFHLGPLTLEDVTDTLSRYAGTNYHSTLRNIPEGSRYHQHRGEV